MMSIILSLTADQQLFRGAHNMFATLHVYSRTLRDVTTADEYSCHVSAPYELVMFSHFVLHFMTHV